MARSLNKVQLIGNLTRDPELRYTPNGNAVCSFGLATGRSWTMESGEKREETDFHRIVSWNKLAELCSQLLTKGRKVYVEGRLSTRSWTGKDGNQRQTTEVVINDMIILDSKRPATQATVTEEKTTGEPLEESPEQIERKEKVSQRSKKTSADESADKQKSEDETTEPPEEEVAPEDIPF